MIKLLLTTALLSCTIVVYSQQGYTFNRISTDDALGLSSNSVFCTYQDKHGYLWVGTANGLQRFDGSKFIRYNNSTPGDSYPPVSDLQQILPDGNGSLWLFYGARKEIGIFNPSTLRYQPITIQTTNPIPARSAMRVWQDKKGNTY